ncbi:hypothetical protein TIFTF001_026554 [Ficus carica]|uniref:Uncharacterized protein n=1 Tax=Ficus carica TaxID=3494 RepID=A0AA88DLC1_FICCA|nr:hypothetical protein TIFTF001_026554 [Ficus carica]
MYASRTLTKGIELLASLDLCLTGARLFRCALLLLPAGGTVLLSVIIKSLIRQHFLALALALALALTLLLEKCTLCYVIYYIMYPTSYNMDNRGLSLQ